MAKETPKPDDSSGTVELLMTLLVVVAVLFTVVSVGVALALL